MLHGAARLSVLLLGLYLASEVRGQDLVAKTEPLSAAEQLQKFHLPPGFEIQLVACEPQIRKPINLNFDHRGRLFATQSVEYPFGASEGAVPRDSVQVFSDIGPDGKAQAVTTFVDGLNIPIGVLPVHRGALFYTIPAIYFGEDSDGDGRAETRRELYRTFGHKDTHGMASSFTRWVDGWIYACHGFSNTSEVQGADGHKVTMQSGNTYRLRPDGSHVEQRTHGQVNPFGMSFDPLGNLYSADCHSLPAYMLLAGAWYPSFGKPDDGLGYGPAIMSHSHGSTGICGVVYYAADHFPEAYRDTLFIGNPVTGRVNHDKMEPHGSSYQAIQQPDFISCDDPWFRPVDLKLGPDGALYIADFYNRIIGHYEVSLTHPGRDRERGRIWRVIYRGNDGKQSPPARRDITKLTPNELIQLLGDPNLIVRIMATNELVDRVGQPCVAAVRDVLAKGDTPPLQVAHGLWVVERLQSLDEETMTRLANHSDRTVRVHLTKALGERSSWDGTAGSAAQRIIRERAVDSDAFVRRAAAEALGRHPHIDNIKILTGIWASAPADDTHLIHTVRMALRDQLVATGSYAALDPKDLEREDFAKRLNDVTLGVRTAESALFVLDLTKKRPAFNSSRNLEYIARYLPQDRLPGLLELALAGSESNVAAQAGKIRSLNRALQERGIQPDPEVRRRAVAVAGDLLARSQDGEIQQGIELAREMKLGDVFEPLSGIVQKSKSEGLRTAAIDACAAADADRSVKLLGGILGADSEPTKLRQKAAQSLAAINNPPAYDELTCCLLAAPERVAIDIAAGLAGSKAGAESLLASVAAGKVSPRVLQEPTVINRLRGANVDNLDRRVSELTAGLPARDDRLHKLIQERLTGFGRAQPNLELGKAAFTRTCAACHRLAGEGNKIGPDLDGVGVRGVERIMEDLLDPNRNVDQAFRSTTLTTADGLLISGLMLREEGQVLILADPQGKEVRVEVSDVDERKTLPVSPMPANVADLLPEADFYHLVAYLASKREQPK